MPKRGTVIESLLQHERALALAGLLVVAALAWWSLIPAARDMYAAMDGPAAWMMQANWTPLYSLRIFVMWTLMMVAMMLPSAAPALLFYATVARNQKPPEPRTVLNIYALAGGYLALWTAFSLAATVLQWGLSRALLITPMMEGASTVFNAVLLAAAGVYQWSPLKQRCLRACRMPAMFLAAHWRRGTRGALRMGLAHGLYCLGCCWALMLLLFGGGVMNLVWIIGLALFVALEKWLPRSEWLSRVAGAALVAAAAWTLLDR